MKKFSYQTCLYFSIGYAACLLSVAIILFLVSVGGAIHRGSGRNEVDVVASGAAHTKQNPEAPNDKGAGRRE